MKMKYANRSRMKSCMKRRLLDSWWQGECVIGREWGQRSRLLRPWWSWDRWPTARWITLRLLKKVPLPAIDANLLIWLIIELSLYYYLANKVSFPSCKAPKIKFFLWKKSIFLFIRYLAIFSHFLFTSIFLHYNSNHFMNNLKIPSSRYLSPDAAK